MVKVGFIGNITEIQIYAQQIRKESGFEIIGKSSVGIVDHTAGSSISVPEYVKSVLIDTADLIIINNSELVSFDLIKESIRKYKHLFFIDFPHFSTAQCLELNKLVSEAGNAVQIKNQLLEHPALYWISENWQEPAYLNYFEGTSNFSAKRNLLIKILMFAYSLFKNSPQKIRVSGINSQKNGYSFLNIRLDYSSYSALNFEILEQSSNEIKVKSVIPGKFIESDKYNQVYINYQKSTDLHPRNEISGFLQNIKSGGLVSGFGLNAYQQVLTTYEDLLRKLTLYAQWYINY